MALRGAGCKPALEAAREARSGKRRLSLIVSRRRKAEPSLRLLLIERIFG
jgi:hypothetical protein